MSLITYNGKYVQVGNKYAVILPPPPAPLILTFDDINNVPVEDASDVDDWNTFFDLPTYGTQFASVSVVDNEITLFGGSDITLKDFFLAGNEHLISIILGDCVIGTGENVLFYCASLKSITLGKNFKSYGYNTFLLCDFLLSIDVDDNNPYYSSVDGILASKDGTSLLCCPAGKSGEYIMPNSVTNIGIEAFTGCMALTLLVIPDSVIDIGAGAFTSCTALTSITIGTGVTSIERFAFYQCSNLKTYNIYAMSAPTIPTLVSSTVFGDYAATLHIQPGATGYDISPWTNTAKFASIVSDL